MDKIKE